MYFAEGGYTVDAKLRRVHRDELDESYGKIQNEKGKKEELKTLVGVISNMF